MANEMYATKLLISLGRPVTANRLTTDAESNVFTDDRRKKCAERRGVGRPKNKK